MTDKTKNRDKKGQEARPTEKSKKRSMGRKGLKALPLVVALALLIMGIPAVPSTAAPYDFDVNVPELTAAPFDTSDPQVYQGTLKINKILSEIYYRDISPNTYGKKAIVRMTAIGALNTFGDTDYRPSDPATGYDVLQAVIGLIGGEADVIKAVESKAGTSTPPDRLKLMVREAYYDDAVRRGIIQPNESLDLYKPIKRERAALFLARAIGAEPQYAQTEVYSFSDWQQVEPYARPYIENLVKNAIITLKADGSFSPRDSISRAELAVWLSGAFDNNPSLIGAKIGYGLIIGKTTEEIREGDDLVSETTFILRGADGKPVNLKSRAVLSSLKRDFVTLKNGITSASRNLEIGDEVEYITIADDIYYVGLIPNGQILDTMPPETDIYTYVHYGTVIDIRQIEEIRDDRLYKKEIHRVLDITGDPFDIVVYEDGLTGVRGDIVTYKGGVIGGVGLINVGDVLQYTSNDKREVGYIRVGNLDQKTVSGTINKYENATETAPAYVTIYGYNDQLLRFPVAPYAVHLINGRTAKPADYVYGLSVSVRVVNDVIVNIIGESYSGEPGYIPPFGKMRLGTVTSKGANHFNIRLANDVMESVDIGGATMFTKFGNPSSFESIKVGEKVKVYYNDISTKMASRVEIEAPEQIFDRIYKGRLENIVPQNGEMHLIGVDGVSKPEYISNNKWEQADTFSRDIVIDPSCQIYAENQKLSPEMLERFYKGYQVYAVTKEVFGREVAFKISVKTGAEMLYSSSIIEVDHSAREFELLTRDNFNISNATIVLKDGLLVPSDQIAENDAVLVASESPNGTYEKNALFVRVTTAHDKIFDSVRIGAIEQVGPSTITLCNHSQLTNNVLEAVNPRESGYYKLTTDSVIKDVSDPENIVVLDAGKLFHNSYARSENKDTSTPGLQFKRYYAFMVVNPANNSIIALNLRKGGLMPLDLFDYSLTKEDDIPKRLSETFKEAVLTRGVITGRDETWDRFELTEAHDFTNYTGRWTATGTNIFVKYSDAIVIKNHRVIDVDDINLGDYVYILRIGTDSLVIFVE